MSDFRPTPARIDLLRAVADKLVYRRNGIGGYECIDGRARNKVSARMYAMEAAGWVKLGPREGPSYFGRQWYELTDRGRQILDGVS